MSVAICTCGESVLVAPELIFTILEINRDDIKLAVCVAHLGRQPRSLLDNVREICRDRACYFMFPQGGCCSLVVECRPGDRLSLREAGTLAVLGIAQGCVLLDVTRRPSVPSIPADRTARPLSFPTRPNPRSPAGRVSRPSLAVWG